MNVGNAIELVKIGVVGSIGIYVIWILNQTLYK